MASIRKIAFICFLFLSGCISTQDDFEKYYNKQSDIYNNLPGERQNSTKGLGF